MTRPLTAVLRAFESGASTLAQVQVATGLDAGVVRAAVDHLTRLGRIESHELRFGCPETGCGSCPSASASASSSSSSSRPGPGCSLPALPRGEQSPGLRALSLPQERTA